jgi:hypothetical protein
MRFKHVVLDYAAIIKPCSLSESILNLKVSVKKHLGCSQGDIDQAAHSDLPNVGRCL